MRIKFIRDNDPNVFPVEMTHVPRVGEYINIDKEIFKIANVVYTGAEFVLIEIQCVLEPRLRELILSNK